MTVVYYLIIVYYHGGATAVPQASLAACKANQAYVEKIEAVHFDNSIHSVYCIAGVK